MRNRSFQASKRQKNCRKLDVALRRLTEDRLTSGQRLLIGTALDPRLQHSLRVYRTAGAFQQAVKENSGNADVRMLFGCLGAGAGAPAAALVSGKASNHTVCIYLPTEMEEE